MPDITMCKGIECPIKENCYRYTAKPSYLQSYFMGRVGERIKDVGGAIIHFYCNHFWDVRK